MKLFLLLLVVLIFNVDHIFCGKQYGWFDNYQDHFDPENMNTWKQKYWVDDSYHVNGGPVFFFLGGEAPIDFFDFQEVSALNWAHLFNATYVALEHRYYGDSNPVANFSTPNLRFLTSQQALADAAEFLNYMKNTDSRFAGKWIVLGCSYSGSLSAWFRLKYPHLVIGSIAPSGPIYASLNYTAFLNHFADVADSQCVQNTKQAVAQITNLLKTDSGITQLSNLFKACKKIVNDDKEIFFFKWTISEFLAETCQWNNPPANQLFQACSILASSSDVVANWAKAFNTIPPVGSKKNHLLRVSKGDTCNSFSLQDMLEHLSDIKLGNMDRAWTWQTCVEYGWFQGTDKDSKVFFPDMPSVKYILPWCENVYGINGMTPNVDWTNSYYGGWDLKGSNILFTNGHKDPWSTISITHNSHQVRAVTYDAAHCAPMTLPTAKDPPSLTHARRQVVEYIKELLRRDG